MKILLGAAALLSISCAAFAAPSSTTKPPVGNHHKVVTPLKIVLVCPVTGDKIASIKDASGFSDYKGSRYYFCCGGCKPAFDKNPSKYIKQAKAPSPGHSAPSHT